MRLNSLFPNIISQASICALSSASASSASWLNEPGTLLQLLKSLTGLVSLALCEHSKFKWLSFVRAEIASLIKLLVVDGADDDIDVRASNRIQSVFKFIVVKLPRCEQEAVESTNQCAHCADVQPTRKFDQPIS